MTVIYSVHARGLGPVLCGDSSCSVSTAKYISDAIIYSRVVEEVVGKAPGAGGGVEL